MKSLEGNTITASLLNWVRAKYALENSNSSVKKKEINLSEIEAELAQEQITNLSIMHRSQDYFTLCYLKEGNPCIKQFTTEEIGQP